MEFGKEGFYLIWKSNIGYGIMIVKSKIVPKISEGGMTCKLCPGNTYEDANDRTEEDRSSYLIRRG